LIRPMSRHSTRPTGGAFTAALPPRALAKRWWSCWSMSIRTGIGMPSLVAAIRSSGRTDGSNRRPSSSEIRQNPALSAALESGREVCLPFRFSRGESRGVGPSYACEGRRARERRPSFRITQLNNRALRCGRDLRVARTANTAPFRPSQQIPMVPRTDIRGTPASALNDNG
jgi:hypothetical protein